MRFGLGINDIAPDARIRLLGDPPSSATMRLFDRFDERALMGGDSIGGSTADDTEGCVIAIAAAVCLRSGGATGSGGATNIAGAFLVTGAAFRTGSGIATGAATGTARGLLGRGAGMGATAGGATAGAAAATGFGFGFGIGIGIGRGTGLPDSVM